MEVRLAFFTDVLPIAVVEFDFGCCRLALEIGRVLRTEWGVSTKEDVGDYSVVRKKVGLYFIG